MSYTLPSFHNQKLLLQALTHRSYVNEHPEAKANNERLEFLGDAILGFVVGELLFRRYSHMSEAQLTQLRSALVDEKQLAHLAKQFGLGEKIRLGKGAEKDQGREKPSLLSDTFEALIAAYFLDAGLEAVKAYIEPLFIAVADSLISSSTESSPMSLVDSKNRFQQWSLATFGKTPQYLIVDATGPDHAKEFTAEVRVNGQLYGVGKDVRKQEAQKRAAEAALRALGLE